LRPALLTWARWPEILGHMSLPGATADVPHLRFSLSEFGLSEFSPSLSLQGRERRGRRRKKRRSRGRGTREVKEGAYKYAQRLTDETSADRGTESLLSKRERERERERESSAGKAKSLPRFSCVLVCMWLANPGQEPS